MIVIRSSQHRCELWCSSPSAPIAGQTSPKVKAPHPTTTLRAHSQQPNKELNPPFAHSTSSTHLLLHSTAATSPLTSRDLCFLPQTTHSSPQRQRTRLRQTCANLARQHAGAQSGQDARRKYITALARCVPHGTVGRSQVLWLERFFVHTAGLTVLAKERK